MVKNHIWNNIKCWSECKNPRKNVCEEGYIWNPATCSCKNGRYARGITDDSVITCDEIMETTKALWQKLFQQKVLQRKKGDL